MGREFGDLDVDEDVWEGGTGLNLPLLQSQVCEGRIGQTDEAQVLHQRFMVGIKYEIGRSDI